MSPRPCRSANRCSDLRCATCAWRYCGSQTIRILAHSTAPLHSITLTIPNPTPEGFRAWRVEIRNRVDYLRREFPVWRKFGLCVFLQSDGTIRGIVSLGRLGPDEVEEGLERCGATLGPEVREEDLRVAVWS